MALDRARMAALASIGAGAALAIGVACGPGNLSDLTKGSSQSQTASSSSSGGAAKTCVGITSAVPPPNTNASNAGGEGEDLVFALDDIRIDGNTSITDASLPPPTGFNLDNNCTCPDKATCIPFDAGPLLTPSTGCDADGGIDNVAAQLLGNLIDFVPSLAPSILKKRITDGVYSMIFDIFEWNHNADDPSVLVSLRMSNGIDNPPDPTNPSNPNGPAPPKFDGNDYWAIDPNSIQNPASMIGTGQRCTSGQGLCAALATDTTAYVVNNTVVAHWAAVNLSLSISGAGALQVPYLGVTMVASISQDPNTGGYKLAGQMGGRWPADKILAASGSLGGDAVAGSQPLASLCGGGYGAFKAQVCGDSDLAAQVADDGTGKVCGALSQAMRFTASKANPGTVHASTSNLAACGGHDGDTCASSH